METAPAQVFLSVGRAFAPEHTQLLRYLDNAVATHGLMLTRLHSDETYYESPLNAVGSLLQSSCGALIVAYPRVRFDAGTEYPMSADESRLPARYLTSVWNQIEATLALHYRLPILTLVESHVHVEGLLSPRHPQYCAVRYHLDACQNGLPPAILAEIGSFANRVREFQTAMATKQLQDCRAPGSASDVD